jgi:hypothetical protein
LLNGSFGSGGIYFSGLLEGVQTFPVLIAQPLSLDPGAMGFGSLLFEFCYCRPFFCCPARGILSNFPVLPNFLCDLLLPSPVLVVGHSSSGFFLCDSDLLRVYRWLNEYPT